jgi:hypothetical protein
MDLGLLGKIKREEQGLFQGSAFCDQQGRQIPSGWYESLILGVLHDHQLAERENDGTEEPLFEGIDIGEVYELFRSFKRGAITSAQEAGVSQPDVEFMGRWRSVEQAAGRKPGRSIREHYREIIQVLGPRLRFSRAL